MSKDKKLLLLNRYLSTEISTVRGWCTPQLWQAIWPLYLEIGDGPISEIGVFEGKFFIGLCKTFGVEVTNKATAIDVFDQQEFNLDGAGVGKIDVLKENLSKHGVDVNSTNFLQADSLSLTFRDADKLVTKNGLNKFFSVDGCHEVTHTVRDIEFAMLTTHNSGIIAVDDYTNPDWPGVQEAVARIYLTKNPTFIPLLVTCNKLLLCSLSYHKRYLGIVERYIQEHHTNTKVKRVKRFGHDTLTIRPRFDSWEPLK